MIYLNFSDPTGIIVQTRAPLQLRGDADDNYPETAGTN